jgi:hypothetical protein
MVLKKPKWEAGGRGRGGGVIQGRWENNVKGKMVGVMLGGWGQPEIVRKAKMGEMG